MPKPLPKAHRDWFETTKAEFPLGAEVRGSAQLDARLAKSRPGRERNISVTGVVAAYDDVQCRMLVYWHHPDYDKLKPADRPLEPLSPQYLELVNGQ